MRNLTLGALIVFGGILAALPFRRPPSPAGPDSTESSLATGPPANLASDDAPATFDPLVTDSASHPASSAGPNRPGTSSSLFTATRTPPTPRGIPSTAVARPRRDLRSPLTYEDLAVPLATPQYTDGRYDALSSRQESQRTAEVQQNLNAFGDAQDERTAFESMETPVGTQPEPAPRPAPWEMASDLPQSILEQPPAPGSTSPAVQGRLASDSQPRIQASPPPDEPTRQRHWIRQPD